jgi:hypothetical protein
MRSIIFGLVLFWTVLVAAICELGARQLIDLKLYGRDTEVGYWILPGQRGGTWLIGSYVFNGEGLAVDEPFSLDPAVEDVVLMGNSLVIGSSHLDQPERLGPSMERAAHLQVWPLAAKGWALSNELRMLRRKPELLKADTIVFLSTARDFGPPAAWSNQYELPSTRPRSYFLFGLRKLIPALRRERRPLPVRAGDLESEWRSFLSSTKARVLVVGYDGAQSDDKRCNWLPGWIRKSAQVVCYDGIVAGKTLTLDGFHPTAAGNRALAQFIVRAIGNHGAPAAD